MNFEDTYLGRLRSVVGDRLLLVPGAAVVVEDSGGRVVLGRRSDMGLWSIPTGGAEEGSSFALTARTEVAEETGMTISESDLVPFGCYSDAHVVTYPSGDVTHWFTLCFVVRRWEGSMRRVTEEMTGVDFFPLDRLPEPLQRSTEAMLNLYRRFRATGVFQVA